MPKDDKKMPSAKALQKQISELVVSLNRSSDLACVIVGTSYLDHCFGSILQHRLADCTTTIELLQPGKPLGDFSARAKLAYCLGLIQKHLFNEAMTIAQIRNQFAHRLFSASFDDEDIKSMCAKLREPKAPTQEEKTIRRRFIQSVSMTSFYILLLAQEVIQLKTKGEDEYPASEWQKKPKSAQ